MVSLLGRLFFTKFWPYSAVRLGNSGLKVSKIILGTMSYGDTRWAAWTLNEEEALKHIKTAWVNIYILQ